MLKLSLELTFKQLLQFFLIVGTAYYFKYVGFFSELFMGGGRSTQEIALEGSSVNKLFGIALILLGTLLLIYSKNIVRRKFWSETWPVWLIPLFCFVSVLWSVEPAYTLKRSIALFSVFIFSVGVITFYRNEDVIIYIGKVISICAVLGLIFALIAPSQVFVSGGIRDGAFIGILGDKNAGARAYAIGLVILFPFILLGYRKFIPYFLVTLLALALAMSASGIGLAAIGMGTVLFLTLYPYSQTTNPVVQCIKVFFLYCVILAILYYAKEIAFMLLNRDSDLTDRKLIWGLIVPLIDDKPMLGYGFGAFWASINAEEFIQRWGFIGNAHNGYLETKLDGGKVLYWIVNSLIFTAAVKSIYYCVKSNVNDRILYSICFSIIVMTVIANQIAHVIPNYYALDFLIFVIVLFVVFKERCTDSDCKTD